MLRSHFRAVAADAQLAATRTALTLALLAHQSWLMCDAIGRTLYRLFVSRRKLLEWVTAQEQNSKRLDVAGHYRLMAGALVISLAVLGLVALGQASALLALPFILAWLSSPLIACWVSQPSRVAELQPVSDVDAAALRLVARRAWHYFDTFVTAADNMLPPDNFQEEPWPVLAHRTSPTNLGLYLLSIVTARDLGWIGTADAVARLESTLATMSRLEQCHGHFYNWYDTQDLRPLEPRYVSSVDSGNLAAHLLTLANACDGMMAGSTDAAQIFAGIGDGLALGRESLGTTMDTRLAAAIAAFGDELSDRAARSEPLAASLDALAARAAAVVALIARLAGEGSDEGSAEIAAWAERHVAYRRESLAGPGAAARFECRSDCRSDWRRWPPRHDAWPRRCASTFSSTRSASCSRSAIACSMAASIPTATTCSRPRRDWRVSSRSPTATSRHGIGSASGAPWSAFVMARRWFRGPARCSST